MTVQILVATTASRIVAVDVREEALQLARKIGAHLTVLKRRHRMRHPRSGRAASGGADVVLDCVGSQASVDIARAVVTTGGDIAIIGLGGAHCRWVWGASPWRPLSGDRLPIRFDGRYLVRNDRVTSVGDSAE